MNRKYKKKIALDTLDAVKKRFYVNKREERISIHSEQEFAEENTIIYSPDDGDELIKIKQNPLFSGPATIEVNDKTTMDAVRQMIADGFESVACLNFASAKNPGGGFLGESQAQEESIARATGLYNCLLKANKYYMSNKICKSYFYTDYMIYSPSVPIIKDENGEMLDYFVKAGIITAPAVNTGVVRKKDVANIGRVEEVMKRRISKVLSIAISQGHQSIILGAWGCGVFGNDPNNIAKYFREVIEDKYLHSFKKIVFAVYAKNERFIKPFINEFF